jgi:hypothetical protein
VAPERNPIIPPSRDYGNYKLQRLAKAVTVGERCEKTEPASPIDAGALVVDTFIAKCAETGQAWRVGAH